MSKRDRKLDDRLQQKLTGIMALPVVGGAVSPHGTFHTNNAAPAAPGLHYCMGLARWQGGEGERDVGERRRQAEAGGRGQLRPALPHAAPWHMTATRHHRNFFKFKYLSWPIPAI